MAIRVRTVNGHIVALCAAETNARLGDLYLNDGVHQALSEKFARDHGLGWGDDPDAEGERLRDAETELLKWCDERVRP